MKKFIVAAGLLTPLLFATNSMAASTTAITSCSNGKFFGEAEYSVYRDSATGGFGVTVSKYRITRSSGQSGGNKANVKLDGYYYINSTKNDVKHHSSDSMKQDGQWHALALNIGGTPRPSSGAKGASLEFVFDKSGTDPKCKVNIPLG